MRLALLLIVAVSAINCEPQFGGYDFGYYPFQANNYFRGGGGYEPQPSFERAQPASQAGQDPRLFFSTVTVTIATTTSTSTLTSTTTCTTSTGTIKACSPSGRRRRGMSLAGDKKGRGLFYNEAEEGLIDGIFYPHVEKIEEPKVERVVRESPPVTVPYVVQPGFQVPPQLGAGRFLVALGTSTSVVTTTSTYTASLTAACKSTTGYLSCSGSGR